mmetsp:Transcript_26919/g.27403  ORF Transcript_26919/g.27403 Transcript_26919/m.27403 type:complete len:413 (-) Transcript_26919:415-1653(-)
MSGPDKKVKYNKKKKKKSLTDNVASLYKEDIGFEGVKRKRKIDNIGSFELLVDEREDKKRKKRMERFVNHNRKKSDEGQLADWSSSTSYYDNSGSVKREGLDDLPCKKLVGTSMALEKPYMRLTTSPKAIDVRPLPVLRAALKAVKAHYIENEDFDYANEQFKSLRQDITVQHLRNKFVLEVYETHARLLLEHGDLNEFNQCQTMIRCLTGPNNFDETKSTSIQNKLQNKILDPDKTDSIRLSNKTTDEFQAYSILYDVVQNSWCDLNVGFSLIKKSVDASYIEPNHFSRPRLPTIAQGSSVLHALNVVKAIIHNDYLAFFRLYNESAPHMSAYLMDYLVRRVRNVAYGRIIAAYRPSISTERFREALSFRDLEETRQFLKKKGAIFLNDCDDPPLWIDCKATYALFPRKGD